MDSSCLQKGEDYIHAFMLGFDIDDAVALLRMDDLYIGVEQRIVVMIRDV